MAKIPAVVWLAIGAVVVYFSRSVGEQFTLFFYLGLVFLGYGLAKLLLGFVLRKKETKAEQKTAQGALPQYRLCPKCGAQIHASQNFCWKCGRRLR